MGEFDAARDHYRQALALLEPLAARQQASADWHRAMVSTLEGLSSVLRVRRELPEALALMRRVAEHARQASALQPGELKPRVFVCAALIETSSLAYMVDGDLSVNRLDDALAVAPKSCSAPSVWWLTSRSNPGPGRSARWACISMPAWMR